MTANDAYFAANRARWDEVVEIHAASDFYGVDRFLAGESTLLDLDLEEVGDVTGKSLLHLQCHFGMDTLSWAREGATVTGLDFSPEAVATARDLAGRAGLKATFVESNVYDAPSVIDGQFDIVYINLGAICWLPDIREWARVASGFVKPGGFLYLRDSHPAAMTLDLDVPDQSLVMRYPYFETESPLRWDDVEDYADERAELKNPIFYEWNHGLGEIINAVIATGLSLEFLNEQNWSVYRATPWMEETEPGIYRLPVPDRQNIPLMFSLRASRP